MASLQDQLLKAGMVDAKKAKQINKEKRKTQKSKKPKKGQSIESEATRLAKKTLQEKNERDRQLNEQRKQVEEQRAIRAQIKQLIETNKISRQKSDIAYQFTHNNKIKKLFVSSLLQNQLAKGMIAIVVFNEQYELVPAVVADKIKQRSNDVVLLQHSLDSNVAEEEDLYADFKIPDDLMW